jgi:hypothetical protein
MIQDPDCILTMCALLVQAMLQLVAPAYNSFDELSLAIGQCMTQEQAAFHPRGLDARQLLHKVSKHMTQEMVSAGHLLLHAASAGACSPTGHHITCNLRRRMACSPSLAVLAYVEACVSLDSDVAVHFVQVLFKRVFDGLDETNCSRLNWQQVGQMLQKLDATLKPTELQVRPIAAAAGCCQA